MSEPTTWNLDAAHTTIGFSIKHLMVTNVRGAFRQATGTLHVDPAGPEKSRVSVTVDVASIDTRMPQRDDHLRGDDFFAVAKFPKLTFQSTQVVRRGEGLDVTGTLSIRDFTREITLHVEELSEPVKDHIGGTRMGVSATGKLRRADFGLGWNKALEAGGVVVGEEVKIQVDAEFTLAS